MNYTEQLSNIAYEERLEKTPGGQRVAATIAAYLFVFWAALPSFLFVTGLRLDELVPFAWALREVEVFFGLMLVLFGATIMAASIGQLWFQGRGLPISHLPPKDFVARGIYKYFRHPIYVGYTIAFIGTSLLISSFWSLTFSSALLLVGWIGYVIFYEEPALIRRFGNRYRQYQRTTALLLPRRLTAAPTRALRTVIRGLRRPLSGVANRTIMFRRGDFILVSYGALVTLGAFLFMYWSSAALLAQGVRAEHMIVFLVGASISILFFARAFWWLGHWREMIRQPILGARRIGFVSFGGFFGWLLFAVIFALLYGYSILMLSDAVVRGMFAAWSVGRLGCLTYGCCYGVESKSWGILYINPNSKVILEHGGRRRLRHPTQFYSFVKNSIFFVLVNAMAYRKLPAGFITAVAFMLYPVARGFVESLRDRRRYAHGVITDGHIGCAVMFVIGWLLLFLISPSFDAASPQPLSAVALREALGLVPLISILSLLGFVATSVHWKRVGTL